MLCCVTLLPPPRPLPLHILISINPNASIIFRAAFMAHTQREKQYRRRGKEERETDVRVLSRRRARVCVCGERERKGTSLGKGLPVGSVYPPDTKRTDRAKHVHSNIVTQFRLRFVVCTVLVFSVHKTKTLLPEGSRDRHLTQREPLF